MKVFWIHNFQLYQNKGTEEVPKPKRFLNQTFKMISIFFEQKDQGIFFDIKTACKNLKTSEIGK